jgi:hypothetical protein
MKKILFAVLTCTCFTAVSYAQEAKKEKVAGYTRRAVSTNDQKLEKVKTTNDAAASSMQEYRKAGLDDEKIVSMNAKMSSIEAKKREINQDKKLTASEKKVALNKLENEKVYIQKTIMGEATYKKFQENKPIEETKTKPKKS